MNNIVDIPTILINLISILLVCVLVYALYKTNKGIVKAKEEIEKIKVLKNKQIIGISTNEEPVCTDFAYPRILSYNIAFLDENDHEQTYVLNAHIPNFSVSNITSPDKHYHLSCKVSGGCFCNIMLFIPPAELQYYSK